MKGGRTMKESQSVITKWKGSDLYHDASSSSSSSIDPKCLKLLRQIRKKTIDSTATGDKYNNILVSFLECQGKTKENKKSCHKVLKTYRQCHSSVMGTGSFNGKKHCGDELLQLKTCIF